MLFFVYQEKQNAKQDLMNLQKAMQELGAREQQDKAEKERLQMYILNLFFYCCLQKEFENIGHINVYKLKQYLYNIFLCRDFRKKMELAKTRIHALQKKQKDTEKLAQLTNGNEKRYVLFFHHSQFWKTIFSTYYVYKNKL